MSVLVTSDNREQFPGMRRFDIRRDLDQVANLIDLAFAEEMARIGGMGQDSIRSLNRYVPLIWATSLFSRQFRDIFSGYVWEEDGKIVGNASISRIGTDGKRWMIGNVAVHPDFRRRGLARKLTSASVEYIREKGGRWALLDVRNDNTAAYELYRSMGFHKIDSFTELRLDRPPRIQNAPTTQWQIRTRRNEDWSGVYELFKVATPSELQAVLPLRKADFRLPPFSSLLALLRSLAGMPLTKRFVLQRSGRVEAAIEMNLQSSKGPNRFSLTLHPEAVGETEEDLVRFSLAEVSHHARQVLIAEVSTGTTELMESLKRHGFQEARTLHRFALAIKD